MKIETIHADMDGVMVIRGELFPDARGYFSESFNKKDFFSVGIRKEFVQENHARSHRGVLRGIHLQDTDAPTAKLVRCTVGRVLDIVVDLRIGSRTFGHWRAYELSSENRLQVYIPDGFGHGYQALDDGVEVQYKCTNFYAPRSEIAIRWDDPDIGVNWPITPPLVGERDAQGKQLRDYLKLRNAFHFPGSPGIHAL